MKRRKLEHWINTYGVAGEGSRGRHHRDFENLVDTLVMVFAPLEKRMTYRDLYEVAAQASASAVGKLVSRRPTPAKRRKGESR